MDEDGCGSGGLWDILPNISVDNVVLSVSYWYCLQVMLCDLMYCCSFGVYWSLFQVADI